MHTVAGDEGDEAFVRHTDCPWFQWHTRLGLLAEDRPRRDAWFSSAIADINRSLGTNIRIETECALPDGGLCCRRRIWAD